MGISNNIQGFGVRKSFLVTNIEIWQLCAPKRSQQHLEGRVHCSSQWTVLHGGKSRQQELEALVTSLQSEESSACSP